MWGPGGALAHQHHVPDSLDDDEEHTFRVVYGDAAQPSQDASQAGPVSAAGPPQAAMRLGLAAKVT